MSERQSLTFESDPLLLTERVGRVLVQGLRDMKIFTNLSVIVAQNARERLPDLQNLMQAALTAEAVGRFFTSARSESQRLPIDIAKIQIAAFESVFEYLNEQTQGLSYSGAGEDIPVRRLVRDCKLSVAQMSEGLIDGEAWLQATAENSRDAVWYQTELPAVAAETELISEALTVHVISFGHAVDSVLDPDVLRFQMHGRTDVDESSMRTMILQLIGEEVRALQSNNMNPLSEELLVECIEFIEARLNSKEYIIPG